MFGDDFGFGGGGGGCDGGGYQHSCSSFNSFNSFDNYSDTSVNYDVNADVAQLDGPSIVFDVTAVNAAQGFAEQARVADEAAARYEAATELPPPSAPRVGFLAQVAGFFGIA